MEPQSLSNQQPFSLQLLDAYTCVIANLPFKLTDKVIKTYQLIHSLSHNGYVVKLKMLISLKRFFQQSGYPLPQLPNTAFKMFKPYFSSSSSSDSKKHESINLGTKKLIKNSRTAQNYQNKAHQFEKFGSNINRRKFSFMHVGKWILTARQKKAINFYLSKGKRMIYCDDQQFDKSVTSLACMCYGKCKKILIMCPKILIFNWVQAVQTMQSSLAKQNEISHQIFDYSKMRVKKQPEDMKISQENNFLMQILDFNIINGNSIVNLSLKQQVTKNQTKFKHQQLKYSNKFHFTICSYEYFQTKNMSQQDYGQNFKNYNGVILDDPNYLFQESIQKDQINQASASNSTFLKILSQIQSIIICKKIEIQKIMKFLPIVNPKIDQNQLKQRYMKSNFTNIHQFKNAVYKNYYFKSVYKPSLSKNLIKQIYIVQNKKINKNMQMQQNSNKIVPFPCKNQSINIFVKINASMQYIKQKLIQNQNQSIYLIYQQEVQKHYLLTQLYNNNIQTYQFYNKNVQKLSSLCQNVLKIGSINELIVYFTKVAQQSNFNINRQKNIVIICDIFSKEQNKNKILQQKLCQIYKYSKIQYLQLCDFHELTYQLKMIQRLDSQLYYPNIDTNKFVNRLISQGQYIKSQQNSQIFISKSKKYVNPQRYQQSQSDQINNQNKMIDQKQQHKMSKDQLNAKQILNSLNSSNANIEDIKQIQCLQVKKTQNNDNHKIDKQIYLSNYFQKDKEKVKKIVEICLDSDEQKQQKSSKQISKKLLKMDIQAQYQHNSDKSIQKPVQIQRAYELRSKFVKNNKFEEIQLSNSNQLSHKSKKFKQINKEKKSKNRKQNKIQHQSTGQLNIFANLNNRSSKKNQNTEQQQVNISRRTRSNIRNKNKPNHIKNNYQQQQKCAQSLMLDQQDEIYSQSQSNKNKNMPSLKPQSVQKDEKVFVQVVEIMSDQDNSKAMTLTPKPQKSRPKQVLSVKLVPRLSQLLHSSLVIQ